MMHYLVRKKDRDVRKPVGICWLLVLSGLAAVIVGACNTSQYKTFSLDHRTKPDAQYQMEYITHFTFEYPREYRRIDVDARTSPVPPIAVTFAHGGSLFSRSGMDSMFAVSVSSPVVPHRTPEAAVDELLSGFQGQAQLLERSAADVAGFPGQLVAFRSKGFGSLADLEALECRYIYFEAEGRLWSIGMSADVSRAGQAKLDFDHIVETFKILP